MRWHFIRRSDEYENLVRKAKFAFSATAFLLKVKAITSDFLSTPETIQAERWLQDYHRSIPGSIQAAPSLKGADDKSKWDIVFPVAERPRELGPAFQSRESV
jgi:hypothetical protein